MDIYSRLPLSIINDPDFVNFVDALAMHRPAFYRGASCAEIISLYSDPMPTQAMDDAMATAQEGIK